MYLPYMRGKQNELIAIRDKAGFLAEKAITPILEPVKASTLKTVIGAVEAVLGAGGEIVIVVNPDHGQFKKKGRRLVGELEDIFSNHSVVPAFILGGETTSDSYKNFLGTFSNENRKICFIHDGFEDPTALASVLAKRGNVINVFKETSSRKLYRRHFDRDKIPGSTRILLEDGFKPKKNSDYVEKEHFSDLHVTYREEGMDGFSDFLIVGDDFSESGGPAYAVAIHLTYIKSNDEMWVYHFKSDRNDSPRDPGGKFLEALTKLVDEVRKPSSPIEKTSAVVRFLELYEDRHFPGLGYVKRLSMIHHIETLGHFLD